MKNFRSLAASLLAATVVTLAPAQSEDIIALRTKAEKGNGLAQYNLGLAYAEGRGVHRDPAEAARWLRLAADQGGAAWQYALGRRFAEGKGVPQDEAAARHYLTLALSQR